MIDAAIGVRTAFFQALNGRLVFNDNIVPVADEMKPLANSSPIWVILGSQTKAPRNTFNAWAEDCTIDLDIVYKTSTGTGKKSLDLIAAQILEILLPDRAIIGLPAQAGLQFLNLVLSADRYLSLALNSSNSVERRILTFKLYVSQ